MDLALATGRGPKLLTEWPGMDGPLVADSDAFQLGERYAKPGEPRSPLLEGTGVAQITVQDARKMGLARATAKMVRWLVERRITAAWLHIDADVLDESVMPAVDSPGTPGLSFEELSQLVVALLRTGRIGGADIAIYDPALDPGHRAARGLASGLGRAFATA
jgi:arginase